MRQSVKAVVWAVLAAGLVLAVRSAWAGPQEIPVFPMGEEARVGDLVYRVERAWWEKVADDHGHETEYLGIALAVTNKGERRIQLPPFQLIGPDGRPREVNYSRIVWPKMNLNPGETLTGKLYFHLPRGEGFQLLISGGYEAGLFAHVEISEIDEGGG